MADFLDCPICLDTISGRAVQCTNGHTFCGTCLDDVTGQSGAIQCPLCRIAMSKRREIRNMFVEKLIKNYDIKRKSELPDDKPVYKKVHVYKKKDANTYKVGDLYLWGRSSSNKKKIWQRQEDETDVQTKISVDDINEDGNVYVKTSPSKMWTVVQPILPVAPVQPPLLINRKSILNSEVDILTNTKNQLNSEVEELVNAKKKLEVEIKKLQFNGKKRKKNNNGSNVRCVPKRLKANKHHKKWEQKDEKLLCQLHKIFDKDYYKKWEQISKIFPDRSPKAIQEKYRMLKLERAKKLKLEPKKRERARKRKLQLARAKTVRIERERKLKLEQKKQLAEIKRKRQKARIEHKRKLEPNARRRAQSEIIRVPSSRGGSRRNNNAELPAWYDPIELAKMEQRMLEEDDEDDLPSSITGRIGAYTLQERRKKLERYLEKRTRRIWDRNVRYQCRKNTAVNRLRVRGRFISREEELSLKEH